MGTAVSFKCIKTAGLLGAPRARGEVGTAGHTTKSISLHLAAGRGGALVVGIKTAGLLGAPRALEGGPADLQQDPGVMGTAVGFKCIKTRPKPPWTASDLDPMEEDAHGQHPAPQRQADEIKPSPRIAGGTSSTEAAAADIPPGEWQVEHLDPAAAAIACHPTDAASTATDPSVEGAMHLAAPDTVNVNIFTGAAIQAHWERLSDVFPRTTKYYPTDSDIRGAYYHAWPGVVADECAAPC